MWALILAAGGGLAVGVLGGLLYFRSHYKRRRFAMDDEKKDTQTNKHADQDKKPEKKPRFGMASSDLTEVLNEISKTSPRVAPKHKK